ncbi:Methyltransferase domain-containing protein [Aliiroseovarius halocynthiae]|uniref:Class I SAM-dependent methyltransferase n=1 Tax=Aliiroseovarius halocynthiae TaxID=985055 RepID=A0A545SWH2_9RHOB|nr:class I SAM-dependent methyltransferase [Aliiroseovarius halocynthiae]TQV69300.1 class I SAM-dependent methyltransferase [Aliiroseovarius halocynthiae]SMR72075.1 Methyltransferase domain-containing protein [Aliiroseovarius halocynthiae]
MGYDYDVLYRDTPQALGTPNTLIAKQFDAFDGQSLSILDIGCGQGRDAIDIARRGHQVHGVDISPHGISDLEAVAKAEGLALTGEVADLLVYHPTALFDVLMSDRTLHMIAAPDRHALLSRLLSNIRLTGWAIIVDEPSNLSGIMQVFDQDSANWRVELSTRDTLVLQLD